MRLTVQHNRQLEHQGLQAQFISTSLEVASTFLTIAVASYSAGDDERGSRAIAKASRSLDYAASVMGHLSRTSPVAATVFQDRLTLLRRERDRFVRPEPTKIIAFPAA